MSSVVKSIICLFLWQKSTGIIESGIVSTTYCLRMSTLSLHMKNHIEYNQHEDGFWWNLICCWIFHCKYFPLTHCVWLKITQDDNNFIRQNWKFTKPYEHPDSLHQLKMHNNTVPCVIINMLYLSFQNDQWLCLYTIKKYHTHKASCLLPNKW